MLVRCHVRGVYEGWLDMAWYDELVCVMEAEREAEVDVVFEALEAFFAPPVRSGDGQVHTTKRKDNLVGHFD